MDGAIRKIAIAGFEQIRSIRHIVRRDVMREIYDLRLRIDVENHTLETRDEIIAVAEIRQQRDEGNG